MQRSLIPAAACLLILVIGPTVSAQAPDTVWTSHFNHSYFDSVTSLALTHDGGFIITGRAKDFGGIYSDILLAKTDSLGNLDWSRRIGDSAWEDAGFHVLQTHDLGYLVSGWSAVGTSHPGDTRIWIVKTDTLGDTLWTYPFDPLDRSSMALAAIQTFDSGFAITGIQNRGGSGNDAFILRLTKDGGYLWHDYYYGGESYDDGQFIAQLPDSGFILAGSKDNRYTFGSYHDWRAIRTTAGGNVVWDSSYVLSTSDDFVYGACLLPDGLVMVGTKAGVGHAIKIGLNGHTIWSKPASVSPYDERVYAVCPSPDGGVMAAGWVGVSGHSRDFHYIKLNADGDSAWTYTVGGIYNDHGRAVVQATDGGYVMAGTSDSWPPNTVVYLTKVAPPYVPGDLTGDGKVNVSDLTFFIAYIFRGGPAPANLNSADVNGNCAENVSDVTYLIAHVFRGGPAPLPGCVE